jgi:glycosyltransferase involved in cell wall biosynthesis
MDPRISICVPTYRRPALLREALLSCLVQAYQPLEILVGDDSDDDRSQRVVAELSSTALVPIRYVRNTPPLGQSGNVNQLYAMASGPRLVLLHDDDRLLPGAIEILDRAWRAEPGVTAVYGKQELIAENGVVLPSRTEHLNRTYYRAGREMAGPVSPIEAALLGQFPNNGYLVLSEAARQVGYRSWEAVGDGCDYDFGIRLGTWGGRFVFVDAFTSQVRMTDRSITSGGRFGAMYRVVRAMDLPASAEYARTIALRRLAPFAVRDGALDGRRREALGIYLSPHYPAANRVKPQGIYHLLLCVWPSLGRARGSHRRA